MRSYYTVQFMAFLTQLYIANICTHTYIHTHIVCINHLNWNKWPHICSNEQMYYKLFNQPSLVRAFRMFLMALTLHSHTLWI